MRKLQCLVKFTGGDHVTNTVQGQRSSSTSSAQTAAEKLGKKLFGDDFLQARFLDSSRMCGVQVWELVGKGKDQ